LLDALFSEHKRYICLALLPSRLYGSIVIVIANIEDPVVIKQILDHLKNKGEY
ncbi:MAG: hypothetical protein ACI8P9_004174, partial [Parasphingorhabdus sp.]